VGRTSKGGLDTETSWALQHLTPSGWVRGTSADPDNNREDRPVPPGTVATFKVLFTSETGFVRGHPHNEVRSERVLISRTDPEEMDRLVAKYGPARPG
jgi:hypothetical protein